MWQFRIETRNYSTSKNLGFFDQPNVDSFSVFSLNFRAVHPKITKMYPSKLRRFDCFELFQYSCKAIFRGGDPPVFVLEGRETHYYQ